MRRHLDIRVTGRVQGVCFRACAEEEANRLGLGGFVRNERDRSVYIEAEGEESDLQAFVQWCHHGPPDAVVREVAVEDGPVRHFESFGVTFAP